MKLTEIMDRDIEYVTSVDDDKGLVTKAILGNREIVFMASLRDRGSSGEHLYIEFAQTRMKTRRDGTVSPGNDYSKTGSGAEIQVLSFISSMIRKALKKFDPETIKFGAEKDDENDNRAALYRKLGEKLFKNYNLEMQPSFKGDYQYFTYTKK